MNVKDLLQRLEDYEDEDTVLACVIRSQGETHHLVDDEFDEEEDLEEEEDEPDYDEEDEFEEDYDED